MGDAEDKAVAPKEPVSVLAEHHLMDEGRPGAHEIRNDPRKREQREDEPSHNRS